VRRAVEDGVSPGALYVCGVPGTGKTAVVQGVLRQELRRRTSTRVLSINALSLSSPLHLYSKVRRCVVPLRVHAPHDTSRRARARSCGED